MFNVFLMFITVAKVKPLGKALHSTKVIKNILAEYVRGKYRVFIAVFVIISNYRRKFHSKFPYQFYYYFFLLFF